MYPSIAYRTTRLTPLRARPSSRRGGAVAADLGALEDRTPTVDGGRGRRRWSQWQPARPPPMKAVSGRFVACHLVVEVALRDL
jgi:hypothetical protein